MLRVRVAPLAKLFQLEAHLREALLVPSCMIIHTTTFRTLELYEIILRHTNPCYFPLKRLRMNNSWLHEYHALVCFLFP